MGILAICLFTKPKLMRFKLNLAMSGDAAIIPINYQYPVSAAIYKIMQRADESYAAFLHDVGYKVNGSLKSFKLFTFSDISTPFKIEGDRLRLLTKQAELEVCFHLPKAAENFIKGLFMHQEFDIADKKSKARFEISSVESLSDPLQAHKLQDIVNIRFRPVSPVVSAVKNEKGSYVFLEPSDPRFMESLVYNWRGKISACFDESVAGSALLMLGLEYLSKPPRSRLITIKADTQEQTRLRGWMNFDINATGERRFVELLRNAGVGVYNSLGCGCVKDSTVIRNNIP